MADADEKAKAEKLAAARKRVAQLQKKKGKKSGKKEKPAGGPSKEPELAEPAPVPDEADAPPEAPEQEPEPVTKDDEPEKAQERSTESFPDAPNETPEANASEKAEGGQDDIVPSLESRHRRQPSLSIQSKMRSSSFRNSSISQTGLTPTGSGVKSPPLPPLSPDGNTAPELFRKQALRLEELERENKRLEQELETADARWKKSEEQLEDLREANTETVELKERLVTAEKKAEYVEKLKAEITALQRQNSHLQTKSHRSSNSVTVSGKPESPPSELQSQLESKSATIEAMELEISNLRVQLASQTEKASTIETQLSSLKDELSSVRAALDKEEKEHANTKSRMDRMIEKSVSEGVTQASTQTLISNLKDELEQVNSAKAEAENRTATMEKKLEALGNLHKESEIRHQARLRERDKFEKDVLTLRRKLVTIENENSRLKEERERTRKREVVSTGDDEALDDLENEEQARLERTIRELEGEIFDLRRGIWKERKRELTADHGSDVDVAETLSNPGGTFDDVDLIGGPSGPEHSRRRSTAANKPRQHSSFATVLSSGIAAFTGTAHPHRPGSSGLRRSLELLSEKDREEFLEDDGMFDEDAFARAQEEEETKKRAEWEREVKNKLKGWKGWRLDLVDCRYGAQGAGVGLGEIFEV
ncbi:hypothetical protein CPC735_060050 [Coccidioides posadasii C735 delta SOWgp]|uniref:M protein repeat protein n=1 Tax=Coccidioides posadasii (strain C735) TaxID=222929 RepID=C5PF55_COCP7|nr:hypothetical protein CPC735_060050 [Coccidioides posadasii C735 delta SOWgp]EER24635.1 hypothetical protein CPC735_060050 [Coccidioides posadasii C735 delta SOWgp]|eukprot:XP_003066780.1 hypothetical protein CPC735_060050 [Coccidioides posadasii C735 delta SOWgp]